MSDVVAARVQEVRKMRVWTIKQLAERCAELGFPELTPNALYNLEGGRRDEEGRRRRNVTVDELLCLADALDVAAVNLLVPLEEVPYWYTPERQESSGRVREWIRGTRPLPSTNSRWFKIVRPDSDWTDEDVKKTLQDDCEAGREDG
ncbi:hypothetical protein ACIQ8G_03695 [Streptomyces sp. NPDC094154]|uniref:hypothetical protein n=1 Tax=Streptomyces sp. NPDC094154 TaxID=3366059 RepID=UPI00382B9A3B